jgi:predicted transcriptional regulator
MSKRKGELFLDYIRSNPGTGAMAMFRALGLTSGGNRNHNLNYLALKRLINRKRVHSEKRGGRVFLYPNIPEHEELHTDIGWTYDE